MSAPSADAQRFTDVIAAGGIVLFPSDTVYGLACDPGNAEAVSRLYALKRRPAEKPSAVMYFDVDAALAALPDLGERVRDAVARLLPGGVTLVLPGGLGLRVVDVPALRGVRVPVLQTSANLSGRPDARRMEDVPELIRSGVDLVIDGGDLPGIPSTVVDLRAYPSGDWRILRAGAIPVDAIRDRLAAEFHFEPDGYLEMMLDDIHDYERFEDELVAACGDGVRSILELGTGTGETATRLLARFPDAALTGIDVEQSMLDSAAARLPAGRVRLVRSRLQDPLPAGPFDLVASALAVHHLDPGEKADLFARVRRELSPGGRFVLADVVIPADPADAVIELTPGYDMPSPVPDQLRWLREAGFASAGVAWARQDLAVITADASA